MSKLFKGCDLSLSTRITLYVFSVLLYGVVIWTLTELTCKKIRAFELWLYRRMLKIALTDRTYLLIKDYWK